MAPLPSRLAVDLSNSLIRVIGGAMGGPMRSGSALVPAEALYGGRIKDPTAVGTALKQLLARTEITETRAIVAAGDAVATFRTLSLPNTFSDHEIAAAVAAELPLDPERITTRWVDLGAADEYRILYAVAWDRELVKNVTDAVKTAGLEPAAVDLKSAALARAVTEPSCVVVDLSAQPVDVVLVDGHVPQVWQSFDLKAPLGPDMAAALATPLRSMLRFYRRRSGGRFGASSPVLVCGEQDLPVEVLMQIAEMVGQLVLPLPAPPRVPQSVRHATFLTCLGLMMRRT